MNYILLNADGSIKKTNFTDIITQNSNEENQIFVSVDGLDISENEAIGVFVLPDKSASVEAGTPEEDVEYSPGLTADGYIITLTSAETALAGLVYLTIQIKKANTQKVLYTYRAPLTINETADLETYVNITLAQYNDLLDYINSALPDINNLVPYYGAVNNFDLNQHSLSAGEITIYASSEAPEGITEQLKIGPSDFSLKLKRDRIIKEYDGADNIFLFPVDDVGGTYTFATQEWVNTNYMRINPALIGLHDEYNEKDLTLYSYGISIVGTTPESLWNAHLDFPNDTGTFALTKQLPKQGVCATFNTSNFTQQSGGNYAISNIQVDDFISGSNVLVITWDNCFAICPIPQSGAGRVCAALWNANGESQIVRVRYELKSNNTLLDISLSGGFTPPSNHTGYVFCYKLFN